MAKCMTKKKEYEQIPEEKYRKLLFQARGQYAAILNVFRCYGMDIHVDQAITECVKVTENFAMTVRGKKAPIHTMNKPKEKGL